MIKKRGAWAGLASLLVCGAALCQQATPESSASEPQAPAVTGLVPDHATLSVANVEREAAWYQRVLGFKVFSKFESDPANINWHLVIPGYRIDLIQYRGSERPAPAQPIVKQQGWIHVSFHVADVAAALQALQALHVDVRVRKDDKGNPIQLQFNDPEGNELEIRRNLVI